MAIVGVGKVVVGVEDQARAKAFWADTVGFTVTTDVPYDDQGNRWVEVTAPDGTILVLSAAPEDRRHFEGRDELPTSNVFFHADDIVNTCQELSERGVDFPAKPQRQPWGWWAMFTDSEGNRFALQQRD
ncbi:VOC family protein [Amycolatopsis sp. DSM 110486]|uniref:VOC family protein n=1 Tax=Amycolatopsis sp. DSM 110486 TaxID=2865832 RepID=UPI001C69D168|nr:VOC family protein [Amycolatopsis sp. DSM 110486]QYN22750.1 VOC family protein [Amycolatopsis sp. DSM 110486]